jgi:hypothetical protein
MSQEHPAKELVGLVPITGACTYFGTGMLVSCESAAARTPKIWGWRLGGEAGTPHLSPVGAGSNRPKSAEQRVSRIYLTSTNIAVASRSLSIWLRLSWAV